jgi:hypothetical protein
MALDGTACHQKERLDAKINDENSTVESTVKLGALSKIIPAHAVSGQFLSKRIERFLA